MSLLSTLSVYTTHQAIKTLSLIVCTMHNLNIVPMHGYQIFIVHSMIFFLWRAVLFFLNLSSDFHRSSEKKKVWNCYEYSVYVRRTSWNVSFFVRSCKFTVQIFSIYLLWNVGQKKCGILYKIHKKHTIADRGNLFTLRKLTFVWKMSGAFWFSVWKHS